MPDEVFSLGRPVELAVVVPAYNERENIAPLLVALETALVGIEWEVIFVDDNSPDGDGRNNPDNCDCGPTRSRPRAHWPTRTFIGLY
jgi:hypothetical protein